MKLRQNAWTLFLENQGHYLSSVYKILAEYKTSNDLSSPKAYHRAKVILDNVSQGTKGLIRRKIREFFFRNELPTLDKILLSINDDDDLADFKRSTLATLIKELNFQYLGRWRNSILKEKDEIINWRRKYLREIRQYRHENRKIYYLDETWLNAGHTVNKVWVDTSIEHPNQVFLEGLSTNRTILRLPLRI